MEVYRSIWKYMEVYGSIWKFMEVYGSIMKYNEVYGRVWKYLRKKEKIKECEIHLLRKSEQNASVQCTHTHKPKTSPTNSCKHNRLFKLNILQGFNTTWG